MSQTAQLINNYMAIRQRLRQPPNAVPDSGINLRPKRVPPALPPIPVVLPVLDDKTECKVTIIQVPKPPREPVQRRIVQMSVIEHAVCTHFKVTPSYLFGSSRIHTVVYPRHLFYYLCRKHTKRSLPEIAGRGGEPRLIKRKGKLVTVFGRDHTVVLHACRKIAELVLVDESVADTVKLLEFVIFGGYHDGDPAYKPESAVAADPQLHLAQEQQAQEGCLSE